VHQFSVQAVVAVSLILCKKVKKNKLRIMVDTLGLLLAVVVHSAVIQNRVGAKIVLIRLFGQFEGVQAVLLDSGYRGKLFSWKKTMFGWLLAVVVSESIGPP
jgi:hypothetical protein